VVVGGDTLAVVFLDKVVVGVGSRIAPGGPWPRFDLGRFCRLGRLSSAQQVTHAVQNSHLRPPLRPFSICNGIACQLPATCPFPLAPLPFAPFPLAIRSYSRPACSST